MVADLLHEQRHIDRMKEVGPVMFAINYILLPSF
jgi:hypothetical protein